MCSYGYKFYELVLIIFFIALKQIHDLVTFLW